MIHVKTHLLSFHSLSKVLSTRTIKIYNVCLIFMPLCILQFYDKLFVLDGSWLEADIDKLIQILYLLEFSCYCPNQIIQEKLKEFYESTVFDWNSLLSAIGCVCFHRHKVIGKIRVHTTLMAYNKTD